MKIRYGVTGQSRKEMVKTIAQVIGEKPKYMGMPSQAYVIGKFKVDKEGTLEFPNNKAATPVLEALAEAGFKEAIGLTVSIPKDKVNVDNLEKMMIAKGRLIGKALNLERLPVKVGSDAVSFSWFSNAPDADTTKAATNLIAAMCKMSMKLKTVSMAERETPNEKYAFRIFLLRLGFIGDEYKTDRKVLLKNLSGSAAFRDGVRK